jgi:hypothetical protein
MREEYRSADRSAHQVDESKQEDPDSIVSQKLMPSQLLT